MLSKNFSIEINFKQYGSDDDNVNIGKVAKYIEDMMNDLYMNGEIEDWEDIRVEEI